MNNNEITITWHIDDVKNVRPDLSDSECREVLYRAQKNHDADEGINWDTLRTHADILFGEEKC